MLSEGVAIEDSRTSTEIPRQRPQIQPLIALPGIARNNANAVAAHIFRDSLLRRMADIQAAEIHSYCQGYTPFQPARDGLHSDTPLTYGTLAGCVAGEGTTRPLYAC